MKNNMKKMKNFILIIKTKNILIIKINKYI